MLQTTQNLIEAPDLDVRNSSTFKPYAIAREFIPILFKDVDEQIKQYARPLVKELEWRIYTVNQSRGRCFYFDKTITIPIWTFEKQLAEREWYIAHELAHAYNFLNKTNDHHGPMFMEWLKKICPKHAIHFELTYKPRNAKAAGIAFLEY